MTTEPNRPQPLRDIITATVAAIYAPIMGLIAALVSAGLITLQTSNLFDAFYGLIPGVITVVATILGAQRVAATGAPLVTPLVDPRDNDMRPLVPAVVGPPAAKEGP